MRPEHIDRLALAIHALRPDWPASSLRTFIGDRMAHKATLDAALALVWVALDPATETPARALTEGPWLRAGNPSGGSPAPQPPRSDDPDLCRICARTRAACRRAAELTDDHHEYTPTAQPTLRLVRTEAP